MKLRMSARELVIEEVTEGTKSKIEEAVAGALHDAADLAVREGKQHIAAAGFSARWQDALGAEFFTNKAGEAGAVIRLRRPFASVFERGATIHAKKRLLWLPIKQNLPAGVKRMSPRKYGKKLVSVNVKGKPPLLFDAANRKLGPLFVGVQQVTIKKRLDIRGVIARAAERMQEFYEQRIKALKG